MAWTKPVQYNRLHGFWCTDTYHVGCAQGTLFHKLAVHSRQQYSPSHFQEANAATVAKGLSTLSRLVHYSFRLDSEFTLAASCKGVLKHSRRSGICV